MMNKNYKRRKDAIDADVVVFGHTHFVSSYVLRLVTRKKNYSLTVDTGWERYKFHEKMRYSNTFINLDGSGACI
jgi:hypothetical protein